MVWNQFDDYIVLDPNPQPSNSVDPEPHTINADPQHWFLAVKLLYAL